MSDNNNASTMIVAIIAIVVIIAIGFVVLKVVPGMTNGNGTTIDVNLPTNGQ